MILVRYFDKVMGEFNDVMDLETIQEMNDQEKGIVRTCTHKFK